MDGQGRHPLRFLLIPPPRSPPDMKSWIKHSTLLSCKRQSQQTIYKPMTKAVDELPSRYWRVFVVGRVLCFERQICVALILL